MNKAAVVSHRHTERGHTVDNASNMPAIALMSGRLYLLHKFDMQHTHCDVSCFLQS